MLKLFVFVCVWVRVYCVSFAAFYFFFFFFFFTRFLPLAATVHVRYMNSSRNIWPVFREQYIRVLFTNPQILFFINFFIKNGSHDTIYTFKNYFATVISAISFQFQQNKSYPNRPLLSLSDTNAVTILANLAIFPSYWLTIMLLYCSLINSFYIK